MPITSLFPIIFLTPELEEEKEILSKIGPSVEEILQLTIEAETPELK